MGVDKADERKFQAELDTLDADMKSVRGRDADKVLDDVRSLRERIAASTKLSTKARRRILAGLDEVQQSAESEDALEKSCFKLIKYCFVLITFGPMLVTLCGVLTEFSLRPPMLVPQTDLAGQRAVVTGGCGAVGVELVARLAESGARVISTCHDSSATAGGKLETTRRMLAERGLLREANSDRQQEGGWVEIWPLELESFGAVRAFASRVLEEIDGGLDLLVHNAATKQGCTLTVDGHELATQVNYLSPVLLTELLLPALQLGTVDVGAAASLSWADDEDDDAPPAEPAARVVWVACDDGLKLPDWLPWPFRRTQDSLLPRIDLKNLGRRRAALPSVEEGANGAVAVAGRCAAPLEYANAKLAALAHSHELGRRLRDSDTDEDALLSSGVVRRRVVSLAVNPGAMDSEFGQGGPSPNVRTSMRAQIMGYFPPVWIAKTLWGVLAGFCYKRMLRSTGTGASAVYHVATASELGESGESGALYWDIAGAFVGCGSPVECGRVQARDQPAVALDLSQRAALWDRTRQIIHGFEMVNDADEFGSDMVNDDDEFGGP